MKKTKKALASFAIAATALSMVPFNALADGTDVSTRLSGNTAVQTAQAISKDYLTSSENAVIAPASAYNMVDALAAAPLAAALKAPVLLTDGNQLSPEVKEEITRLNVKTVYVSSGLAVIKAGVISELQGLGVNVINLGGYDQYETSVNIAKVIANVNPTSAIFIANGETARVAQDALSVASIAGAQKQPLLLTKKGALPQVVADYINSIKANVTASYITGGTGVVSDEVKAQLPGTVYRNAGNDAYDTNLQVLENFTGLDFDRIFVANGQTMIDALAGAPLAAQTDAPIVLVNGSLKSATADFLKTKVTSKTVVTALGGEAVVPEALRSNVANPTALNVTTVAGTSSNVYLSTGDQTLGISVNGADKSVSELVAAGYTVQFQATKAVFLGEEDQSDDGIIENSDFSDLDNIDDGFYYTVNIFKGDTLVASSDSKHVSFKEKTESSSAIDSVKVFLANNDDITDDPGSAVEVKSGKITTDDTAMIRVKGNTADDIYKIITGESGLTYTSSDPSIAYVDKQDDEDYSEIKTGGNTGAVTITVKSSDGTTKELNLNVVSGKRKADASNSTISDTAVKLDNGSLTELAFTLKDQYGDPMKDQELKYTNPADGDGDLADVSVEGFSTDEWAGDGNTDGTTDKKGRAVIKVDKSSATDEAVQKNTGSGTFKIKDKDSNVLKSVSFNGYSTNSASKYQLDVVPFKTTTLDASDSDDKTTYVEFNAYDSNGGKLGDPDNLGSAIDLSDANIPGEDQDSTKAYTIKIDGDTSSNDYIKVAPDGNRLKITSGKKTKSGSVAVSVYESGIKRATVNITPGDLRNDITGVTFESNRPTIGSIDEYDLKDFVRAENIKTADGSPVYFEVNTDNALPDAADLYGSVYVEGIDGTILGEIKTAVTEGDMYAGFTAQGEVSDSPKIQVDPTDDHVDGKVVLTLNKLNGGVDADKDTTTFAALRLEDGSSVDIPGTSTYVGSVTINVNDVSSSGN